MVVFELQSYSMKSNVYSQNSISVKLNFSMLYKIPNYVSTKVVTYLSISLLLSNHFSTYFLKNHIFSDSPAKSLKPNYNLVPWRCRMYISCPSIFLCYVFPFSLEKLFITTLNAHFLTKISFKSRSVYNLKLF